MSARYAALVRHGPKVERERYDTLEEALAAIESRGRRLEQEANATPVGGRLLRRIDPQQQVVARIELKGPRRLRAGVDVRGDGSSETWTGRVRKQLVEQRRGESPYDALRRTLSGGAR